MAGQSTSYHYYEENGLLYNAQPIAEVEHAWELEHDALQVLNVNLRPRSHYIVVFSRLVAFSTWAQSASDQHQETEIGRLGA